ncbi:hypothetical protein GX408_19420, partial [bacterium]|nr:hypothetical protein [bacterium]
LITDALEDVIKMMHDHLGHLHAIAQALLEKEMLDGQAIEEILNAPAPAGKRNEKRRSSK